MDGKTNRDDGRAGWGAPSPVLLILLACALMLGQTGCSLFVMAGKMLYGDPKITCEFTARTHVNLSRDHKRVLVIATIPETIRQEFPALDFDIVEGVALRLHRRDIETVDLNRVATWVDDNGGFYNSENELANEFDCDYIVHFDLSEFDYREMNSAELYRGRASGNIYAYEVRGEKKGQKSAVEVFVKEFRSIYPGEYPVSSEQVSAKVFAKRYLDITTDELARLFYNHHMSETLK